MSEVLISAGCAGKQDLHRINAILVGGRKENKRKYFSKINKNEDVNKHIFS